MKTIILKFSGPLQSWGRPSSFETRHTDFYPTKSAVLGIISASFGYSRDDEEKLLKLNELLFAVRVDQPGRILEDYHIARKYKDNGKFERTYVTNRYYIEDAVFLVGISHQDDVFMQGIEEALRNPYYQAFMGRRSLPLPYDFIMFSNDEDLIDTIKKIPWQASEWFKTKNNKSLSIYADSNLLEVKNAKMRRDRAVSFSQKNRKFEMRFESRIEVELKELTTSLGG